MENPLLDAWREIFGADAPFTDWARTDAARATGNYAKITERYRDAHARRRVLTARYSFAVPTDEALDAILDLGPVVEIGAGTGYWSKLLRERGGNVVAYDLMGDKWAKWFPDGLLDRVELGDVDMAGKHADRTLLLVWPPYSSPMAFDALVAYEKAGGRHVVYVGEGQGGCTGDDDFHYRITGSCEECRYNDEDDEPCPTGGHPVAWREVREITIPQLVVACRVIGTSENSQMPVNMAWGNRLLIVAAGAETI